MELLRNIWNEEEGQGLVEYGLIIALVAIVVIVGLGYLSEGLNDLFGKVKAKLTSST